MEKNYSEAMKWYEKSAAQGSSDAQRHLGHMYFAGLGMEKDYEKALEWYNKVNGE